MKLFFFIAGIILIALGELTRIDLGNSISFALLDVVVVVLSFFAGKAVLSQKKLLRTPLTKSFILFISICVLSLVINVTEFPIQQILIGSLYTLRLILYTSFYFIAKILENKQKSKIKSILTLSGIIVIFFGLFQYFLYPYLGNLRYLGWDDHLYRLFSTFFDPNFTGIFLAFFILYIIGNFISDETKKDTKHIVFYILLFAFSFVALFLTYSRTSYLSLLTGIFVFLFLQPKMRKILLAILGITILSIFVTLIAFRKLEGTNLLRNASTQARVVSYQTAITIFNKRPVLGVGFDMYRYAQRKYGFLPSANWQTTHAGASPDNSFLLVLVTTGIIGFIAFLNFLYRLLRQYYELQKKNYFAAVVFASCIAWIFSSLFLNSFFYPFFLAWMWTLAGLTENI